MKYSFRSLFAVLAFLVFSAAIPVRASALVEDGRPRATIVVAPDAPSTTQAAVRDLAHYIERVSGAELPATASAADVQTPLAVWVGPHEGLAERFPAVDMRFDKPEELVVASQGGHLLLIGRDRAVEGRVVEAGTSLAVYEFLERHLGVRWLWPGELGEDVPELPDIRFDDFVWRYAPPLRQRHARLRSFQPEGDAPEDVRRATRELDRQTQDWHRRQRGTYYYQFMRAGHAFTRWYAMFGEEHPEYFALQADGSRRPYPRDSRVKLCISNPDVARQWLDLAQGVFEAEPARLVYSASPNDGAYSGVCRCAGCRAWDVPGGPPVTLRWVGHEEENVALTDRYVRFWNRIARGLKERLPGREAYVGVWAYGPYRTPPVERSLEDNIFVGFVGRIPADDSQGRMKDRETWEGWAAHTENLVWRPNLFHGHWGTPVVFARRAGEDFRFMADRKLKGVDLAAYFGHWSTMGLQYYVLSQLSWNPYADVDALLADYFERAFGAEAAPHIARYFGALERAYHERQDRIARLHRYQAAAYLADLYTPDFLGELEAHLAAAREAVTGPRAELHRRRIAFVATGMEYTRAQSEAIVAMQDLRSGGRDIRETAERAFAAAERRDRIARGKFDCVSLNTFDLERAARTQRMLAYLGPPGPEYQALLEADDRTHPLPTEWAFRLDPRNEGEAGRWFDPGVADGLDWQRMSVTSSWNEQLLPEDPDDPERHVYYGAAWYRTSFDAPPAAPGDRVWLRFGAVDESCWVYVNGEQVGAQVFDRGVDRDAWAKPRRFDITENVRPGENDLAVKVQALSGQAGIVRPAHLETAPPNLVRNGGFGEGMEGWRMTSIRGLPEDLFSASMALGMHVEEPSLSVRVQEGGLASLGRSAPAPLREGQRYLVRVRFQQKISARLAPTDRPVAFRLYGRWAGDPQAADRFWLHSAPRDSDGWEHISGVFEAPRDYDSFTVTIQFWKPGTYLVDEVLVREE